MGDLSFLLLTIGIPFFFPPLPTVSVTRARNLLLHTHICSEWKYKVSFDSYSWDENEFFILIRFICRYANVTCVTHYRICLEAPFLHK